MLNFSYHIQFYIMRTSVSLFLPDFLAFLVCFMEKMLLPFFFNVVPANGKCSFIIRNESPGFPKNIKKKFSPTFALLTKCLLIWLPLHIRLQELCATHTSGVKNSLSSRVVSQTLCWCLSLTWQIAALASQQVLVLLWGMTQSHPSLQPNLPFKGPVCDG